MAALLLRTATDDVLVEAWASPEAEAEPVEQLLAEVGRCDYECISMNMSMDVKMKMHHVALAQGSNPLCVFLRTVDILSLSKLEQMLQCSIFGLMACVGHREM